MAEHPLLKTPIAALQLSTDVRARLKLVGVTTIGQLARMSRQHILDVPYIGEASLSEIESALADYFATSFLSGCLIEPEEPSLTNAPLGVLGLSTRAHNTLMRAGIRTVGKLVGVPDEYILSLHGIGTKSLAEIKRKLNDHLSKVPASQEPLPESLTQSPLGRIASVSPVDASIDDRQLPEEESVPVEESKVDFLSSMHQADDMPLDVLGLSQGAYNCLRRAGFCTIAEVAILTDEQLLDIRNLGVTKLSEIREKLASFDFEPPEVLTTAEFIPPLCAELMEDEAPLAKLNLSTRPYNALTNAGVETISALARMNASAVLALPHVDSRSLAEIQSRLTDYAVHPPPPVEPATSSLDTQVPIQDNTPLKVLGLSVRAHNALMRWGITTLGQLAQMSPGQTLDIRNIGRKSLAEIEEKLETYLAEHSRAPIELVTPSEPEPTATVQTEPLSLLIDLSLLARAAQVPLDDISVERLALPVHWRNQLRRRCIESIGELAQQPAGAFDQDSPVERQLNRYLTWLVEQDEATWANETADRGISPLHRLTLSETTLEVLVGQWLDTLVPQKPWASGLTKRSQYRQVIRWRYGLDGESLTLEEIGEHVGVTRERVRQIQGQALRILRESQHREVILPLAVLLVHLLEQSGGLMSEAQIDVALRREVIIGDVEPVGVARLVFETEDSVKWLRKTRAWGLTHCPLAEVSGVQHGLIRVLEKEHVPLLCEEVVSRFKNSRFYRNRHDKLGSQFTVACLRVHPEILIDDEGLCSLEKWERHRIDKIILALRKIGRPAHYREIARVTNELLRPELRASPRVIHAQLGQHPGLFVWVGQRGTYGLKEWGLEKPPTYEEALVQVFKASEGPLTLQEILALLPEVRPVCNENSVSMTLMMSERFRTFPDGTYGLSSWSLADDVGERTLPPDFLEDVKQRLFEELSAQAQPKTSIQEVSRVTEG